MSAARTAAPAAAADRGAGPDSGFPAGSAGSTGSAGGVAGAVAARHLTDLFGDRRPAVHDLYDEVGGPIYHDISRRDPHEIRQVLAAVRAVPGPVLDLAAGSGRLTVPLLALGRPVTALELSPTMRSLLAGRLAELPAAARARCRVVADDMRTFVLPERFGAVVLATTTISLFDAPDRARVLERIRAHLAPHGRLLLSTVEIVPGAPTDSRTPLTGAGGRAYWLHERVDPAAGVRSVVIHPDPPAPDGPVCAGTVRILRPDKVTAELARHGLALRSVEAMPTGSSRYRDWMIVAEAATASVEPAGIEPASVEPAGVEPVGAGR